MGFLYACLTYNLGMKITFIYPRFEKLLESRLELTDSEDIKRDLGDYSMPPALGIPIMTALSKQLGHTVNLYDENVEEIDYDDDADLIAVSFFTPQAMFAFEVAKKYKAKGKTVIAGGMHPSLMAEECLQYFDAVCLGEVENVWEDILKDVQAGNLKKTYQKMVPDMNIIPKPDRSLFEGHPLYNWEATLIQCMRGCPYKCETCIVPAEFGRDFRFKDVDRVVNEITSSPIKGDYYLIDDTLVLPHRYCVKYRTEFFEAFSKIKPKPRLFLSGSLNMKSDPEFLKSLADGGVVDLYIVTGSDPYSIRAFQEGQQKYFDYGLEMVDRIQQAGISVFMSIGLGFDHQDKSVFDRSLEWLRKADVRTAEFFIMTPFPQTPSWHQFKKEDRILHYDWTKYNTGNVVFKPKNFTEQELLDGFIYCWKQFYTEKSVAESLSIFK